MGQTSPEPQRLIGIVEDDPAVLHSLGFALQAEGYAVCALACAAEATSSPSLLNADCLVLDYGLPDKTGVALLRELRGRGVTCPAILIASNPTRLCREESRAIGAPLIEKPLMGEDLSAGIRAALATAEPAPLSQIKAAP